MMYDGRKIKGRITSHLRDGTLYHVAVLNQLNNIVQLVFILLPFDRARWFGADIINHAVNSLHFGNDSGPNPRQEIMREPRPICRHAVDTRYRSNCHYRSEE